MDKMAIIVLAAGQGTRMKSTLPKVLHCVSGQPLVSFSIRLAESLKSDNTVVVIGHGKEVVKEAVKKVPVKTNISFAIQEQQLGTGHAVMAALPQLKGHKGQVLILSGDVPLLEKSSITKLKKAYKKVGGPVAIMTFVPKKPFGYGRIIKEKNKIIAIREHKDCSKSELTIGEVNAGIYLFDIDYLKKAVKKLTVSNSQSEFYLTDLIELASIKTSVASVKISEEEVSGVNNRIDLAAIDAVLRIKTNSRLMTNGVTIKQPATVQVDFGVKIGMDTQLDSGVQIHGNTVIGKNCIIESGAIITDSIIKDNAIVKAYSVLEKAQVGKGAQVGPMGRLRPGAILEDDARVGNFVELKNTILGKGSKASHLAYLGDGQIGEGVNVGAGVIFCNYDGFLKHKTVLEDGVFVGSDSQLIAPVTVGEGAYIASGSTITTDIPAQALAIARSKQLNKKSLGKRIRQTLKAKKEKLQKDNLAKEKKK